MLVFVGLNRALFALLGIHKLVDVHKPASYADDNVVFFTLNECALFPKPIDAVSLTLEL